jgi:hypothetical protein
MIQGRLIPTALRALAVIVIAFALPSTATAQVLIDETSARFDWTPSSGSVEFYEVYVSRSTRDGSYAYEQTVTDPSVVIDAGMGEVVRIRVRAGNSEAYGPLSAASDSVRLGLPVELPVQGTPGVFEGRVAGSDTGNVFYQDPDSGEVWLFSVVDGGTTPTLLDTETDGTWHLAGSGDFDGDGRADLFWRRNSGSTRIWYLDANGYETEKGPFDPGASWQAEITSDFDGNGQDDLLWREGEGAIRIWFRVDTEFQTAEFPPMPTSTWEILAAGDYDGDGLDDVFWRDHTSTDTVIWFTVIDSYNGIYARARISEKRSMLWEVFEARDDDGDGRDDVHWRLKKSHDMTEWWYMDGESVRTD